MVSNTFYQHLHWFRGFAILNIVAAHCWTILIVVASLGSSSNEFLSIYAVSETLFHNATIYFALISGLLFSLVLKKYSWKKFYSGKFKYVVIPYLLFSVAYAFIDGMLFLEPGEAPLPFNDVISALPMHIVAGSSFAHMWYIPVLVVLFLLTPLFQVIVSKKSLASVLVLITIAPLFFSRSWPNFVWENFVFFFGPYILGMFVGNHYQQTLLFVDKIKSLLVLIVVIFTLILFYLYLIELDTIYGVKLQESFLYIQKLCIAFLVLNILQGYENRVDNKLLTLLGDYSFSIYFVHMFFAGAFAYLMVTIGFTSPTIVGILLSGFVLLPMTILASVGFTLLIKKLAGGYSRFIIGS